MMIHQADIIYGRGACPFTVTINNEIWGIFRTESGAMQYMTAFFKSRGMMVNFNRGLEA